MKMRKLAFTVLLSSTLLFFPFTVDAQARTTEASGIGGSICVLPNSPEPPTRISPGGDYNPDTLKVRIDEGEPISWPYKQPVLIDNLDLQATHLAVITSEGKRIQSLKFKFSKEDDARLCIYFDGYQGVQLGNKKNTGWCRVKVQACWQ
jgi:hypothetical protein